MVNEIIGRATPVEQIVVDLILFEDSPPIRQIHASRHTRFGVPIPSKQDVHYHFPRMFRG